jgi:hypothetical protein
VPGWRENERKASFEDLPVHLVDAVSPDVPDEVKRELHEWVESHGLLMVDFFTWKRDQLDKARGTKRPPTRRRWLSGRERAELDAEREKEPFQW